MKLRKNFFFVFILLSYSQVLAQGVYEAWVARYDGGVALALAVDDSGNAYVTGLSAVSGTSDDYTTIKYNSNGDTLWVRRYNGPPGGGADEAYALAVDDSGNVYVTGWSVGSGTSEDYATIKYNSSGDTLWVRRYNGPGNLRDAAGALVLDDSGNLYVTGYSTGTGSEYDYATIKYDSNGDTLWVRRYDGPGNGRDVANALVVDNSGNLYVTGYSTGTGTNWDYATIKYNFSGDTLWVKRYNGPGNGRDYPATALKVDDSGNVYVSGTSWNGTDYDYATIKYNSNGDTLWVRRYNGPGSVYDRVRDLAVDGSGNVYVTGYSYGGGAPGDYLTIKYNSSGETLWVRRYDGPGNHLDLATALAVDSSGNVYVTGYSYGGATNYDCATIKYDSSGDTLWVKRYNGPGNLIDYGLALEIDGSGNVYVTGLSGTASRLDYATIKYSPCAAIPGDANADSTVQVADVVTLVNYLFKSQPAPNPLCRADANADGTVLLSDIVYLINFIFKSGPAPLKSKECCL